MLFTAAPAFNFCATAFASETDAAAGQTPPASAAAVLRVGDWINQTVFDNVTGWTLLSCLVLVLLVFMLERALRSFIRRKRGAIDKPEEASWKRLLLKSAGRPLSLFIWSYGLYAALSPAYGIFTKADGSNTVWEIAKKSADIGAAAALIWFLFNLTAFLDIRLAKWSEECEDRLEKMLAPFLSKLVRIFIVVVGGLIMLQNLTGIEVGPLIASLGIGGLAVALAAKDSIANFFGTLTILFDKPFEVGDRIVIDSFDGVVESVGFRSTRIRTLTGNLVTIPNEKVVNSGLENIGRRPNIRWLANIGIVYGTPTEKVAEAVDILRSILTGHEGMHPDLPPRVHFNGFNDWSLNITVLAWYHPPDWWAYQAWLQGVCLEILRRFRTAGIEFAFPSHTIYMADDRLPLPMLGGESRDSGLPGAKEAPPA